MSFFFDRWLRFLGGGALIFLLFLISVQDVYTQGPPPPPPPPGYSGSAHGDTSTGVNRSSTTIYNQGQCAHCHEQHASINGDEPDPAGGAAGFCLLANNFSGAAGPYVQSDNACFYCHYGTGTLQTPAFDNYTYSRTFGGYTADTTASIMEAFNLLSYHNLNDVLDFATANWSTTFTASSNPCSACHNVHIAKRNKADPGDPTETAISKPSEHDKLWGNDDGIIDPLVSSERMNAYSPNYQAPYYYYSVTPLGYEPNNSTTIYDGSNIPDYVTFCQDCHDKDMTAAPYSLPNTPIDWEAGLGGEDGGDKHGKNVATEDDGTGVFANLVEPYATAWGSTNGLVLSCTDCHEPHGASSVMLIRREINGTPLTATVGSYSSINWQYVCARCHDCDTGSDLEYIHHGPDPKSYTPGPPYSDVSSCGSTCHPGTGDPIQCTMCHFHGGNDDLAPVSKTGRRTF